jgi:hypothetical protein
MIGFGIDLAGYTTGKTSLAVVEIDGQAAKATLLRGSALSAKRKSGDALREVLSQEVAALRRCLAVGPVAVDVPIDPQALPNADGAEYIWQLTRRPIDQAMNAMPPFADRIGAPVARFAAIMREGDFFGLLGERLFEAYPAGTLKMRKVRPGRYKDAKGTKALISLCGALKIEPHVENDHDVDAIICAIAAAVPADAVEDVSAFKIRGLVPKGFRIPKSISFTRIGTTVALFADWMAAREAST